MDQLYILLQILLATVFVFSGAAKLLSRISFHETLAAIGLSHSMSKMGSWVFPIVEIIAAGLLLYEPLRLVGEIVLLLMLAGFIVISIRAMRNKQKVSCQCFGELVDEPLGMATLIRSIVLIVCVVPLLIHTEETGLYSLEAMDVGRVIFSSLGILMIYGLFAAHRSRIAATKGGAM